ncbi:hypothetical protein BC567DRAFT_266781 [Phyllosticta citribraziliensis]
MAPSAGHLHKLLARNSKLLRQAWKKTQQLIRDKLPPSLRPAEGELIPVYARNGPRHPLSRAAALRQSKGRWYTTHSYINATVRRFTTEARQASKSDRPTSRVWSAVNQSAGRAPFATTLRPNLTGGTLGRTAGGYSIGGGRVGGARYFSHGPAAPAQVVHNVSQAVRAFMIGGQKAQFDGFDPRTGEKRFRAVSATQEDVSRKMATLPRATPGSSIEFSVNPTITALTPLGSVAGFTRKTESTNLNTEGLLDVLSADFSRALKELAMVLNDLKSLSQLGDLPITHQDSTLCVHFPGCDADTVERLCDELGVRGGFVRQDEDFDTFAGTEIALLFPFAPSKTPSEASFYTKPAETRPMYQAPIQWQSMLSREDMSSTVDYSTQSDLGLEGLEEVNPWVSLSSPSGYESIHSSHARESALSDAESPLEYQGFDGIYQFIQQCDNAPRCF